MPYRRLPNTDSARLKALSIALKKGRDLPPFKLAYQQGTLQKINSLLPSYENALSEHKAAYNLQIEKSKDFHKSMKKARLYISHFIQVINMAVVRGDLPVSVKNYFHMEIIGKKLPNLGTTDDVIHWADILIEGESKRRMEGRSPITNPTIAVVKVHCDKFRDAYVHQESLKTRYQRAQESLNLKREEADIIIQRMWNEVEATFKDLPETLKRTKASEYGVVYVYRKNELGPVGLIKSAQAGIG